MHSAFESHCMQDRPREGDTIRFSLKLPFKGYTYVSIHLYVIHFYVNYVQKVAYIGQ